MLTVSQFNTLDHFAATNGITLLEDGATATMVVEERHLNGAGVCQGGALFTLADLAAAGLTRGEKLTINSDIRFLRPARLGDTLTATARYIKDARIALLHTDIFNQEQVLVAQVTAQFVSVG